MKIILLTTIAVAVISHMHWRHKDCATTSMPSVGAEWNMVDKGRVESDLALSSVSWPHRDVRKRSNQSLVRRKTAKEKYAWPEKREKVVRVKLDFWTVMKLLNV